jgi:hypothetical protein
MRPGIQPALAVSMAGVPATHKYAAAWQKLRPRKGRAGKAGAALAPDGQVGPCTRAGAQAGG